MKQLDILRLLIGTGIGAGVGIACGWTKLISTAGYEDNTGNYFTPSWDHLQTGQTRLTKPEYMLTGLFAMAGGTIGLLLAYVTQNQK